MYGFVYTVVRVDTGLYNHCVMCFTVVLYPRRTFIVWFSLVTTGVSYYITKLFARIIFRTLLKFAQPSAARILVLPKFLYKLSLVHIKSLSSRRQSANDRRRIEKVEFGSTFPIDADCRRHLQLLNDFM